MREFDEAAAIFEYEANIPRIWAEAFARLDTSPHADLLLDILWIWHIHKEKILKLGWKPSDVKNLIPLIRGRSCIKLEIDHVVLWKDGIKSTIYKRPVIGLPSEWQEGRRKT